MSCTFVQTGCKYQIVMFYSQHKYAVLMSLNHQNVEIMSAKITFMLKSTEIHEISYQYQTVLT